VKHTVIAVFDTPAAAQQATQALKARGLDASVSHDTPPESAVADEAEVISPAATIEGGPLSGLLHRLSVLFGVADTHLAHYEEAVRRGSTVVHVHADDEAQAVAARDALLAKGAVNIDDRVDEWQQAGWRSPAEADAAAAVQVGVVHRQEASIGGVRVYSHVQVVAFDDLADEFRADFAGRAVSGDTWQDFDPAYRYGHALAQDTRFQGLRWDEMEPDARAEWERRYPQNAWERFKSAVQRAWERTTRP
jgi:hypothetical protein